MTRKLYRFTFSPDVPPQEVEASMLLAVFAVESLHGEVQVRLDAAHSFDPDGRSCVIDAGTAVGRDLNRVFIGFLRREFGEDAFRVERVDSAAHPQPQEGHPCASWTARSAAGAPSRRGSSYTAPRGSANQRSR